MNELHRKAFDAASDQSGVTTRTQARASGLSLRSIDRCLANGLLVPLMPRVYRVRGASQSERMAITAAVLGAQGRASHATATRLLRLNAPLPLSPIHVTVEARIRQPRIARVDVEAEAHGFFAVKVHRRREVGERVLEIDGIPCVDGARALFDVAPTLTSENLEIVFERARKLGLVSTVALARRFELIGGRGCAGTPAIRELLAHAAPNPLDSALEVKGWRLVRTSPLVLPQRQFRVDLPSGRSHRLDFAWPDRLVAFETEGFEWHGSRARWKQDRQRTAALERLGWRIVVGTWDDVVKEPRATLDRIAMALGERRGRS